MPAQQKEEIHKLIHDEILALNPECHEV